MMATTYHWIGSWATGRESCEMSENDLELALAPYAKNGYPIRSYEVRDRADRPMRVVAVATVRGNVLSAAETVQD